MGQNELLLLCQSGSCVNKNDNNTARDMQSEDIQRMPLNPMNDIQAAPIGPNQNIAFPSPLWMDNVSLGINTFPDINQNLSSDFRNVDCHCGQFHCRTCLYRRFNSPQFLMAPMKQTLSLQRRCDKTCVSKYMDTLKRPRSSSDGDSCEKSSHQDLRRMHSTANGRLETVDVSKLYESVQLQTGEASENRGPDHFAVNFLNRPSRKVLSKEYPNLIEPSSRISSYTRLAGTPSSPGVQSMDIAYQHLHEAGWYHGPLTMSEARDILRPYPVGTFLLRDSSDANYIFSLSFKTRRGTTSIRIIYREGQFRLDAEEGIDSEEISVSHCIMRLLENYSEHSHKPRDMTKGKRVLLESTGRMDTPLVLSESYRKNPSSLKHLSRLTLNRMCSEDIRRKILQFMPPDIEEYMMNYKFVI